MLNQTSILSILCTLLLLSIMEGKRCSYGQVSVKGKCISCQSIKDTAFHGGEAGLEEDECACLQGFRWSSALSKCITLPQPQSTRILDKEEDQQVQNRLNSLNQPRLLVSSCNVAAGYIFYQSTNASNPTLCTNCRLMPFGLNANINDSSCSCDSSFKYDNTKRACYCYLPKFINMADRTCQNCVTAGVNMVACQTCSPPFFATVIGCVYAPSVLNGAATATGCVAGYYFSGSMIECVCDASQNYAVNANGICVLCSLSDIPCYYCQFPYVYYKQTCRHVSLIPKAITTGSALTCQTGYMLKYHFFNSMMISCACSRAAGYYQNGANCISCATTLPSGVTLANCQACLASSKFYAGSVECVYCPGVTNSLGTATINGCDCAVNYFWNMTSTKCQCDFVLGYVAGATGNCIACSTIANTDVTVFPNACSCLKGYKWNPTTRTCDYDTTASSNFVIGTGYNCYSIQASNGSVAANGQSCVCYTGTYWNPSLLKCVCDFNQNFVVVNGLCRDCKDFKFSNGLANAFGCICTNGLSWSTTLFKCVCPAGSVMIGINCVSCASATLPSGAVVADCSACTNAKGFASSTLGCYSCVSQTGANSAVTNNACTCSGIGQAWKPLLGACACHWRQPTSITDRETYVTNQQDIYPFFSCNRCPHIWWSGPNSGKCACAQTQNMRLLLDSVNQVCTNTDYTFNGSLGTQAIFSCKPGYVLSDEIYPHKCLPGYAAFKGFYSSSTNTWIACTTIACQLCSLASGYLLLAGSNSCLLCSTVSGSSGVAQLSGCVCISGQWNPVNLKCDTITCATGLIYNPVSKTCVCDPVKSVAVGSTCVSCGSVAQSTGYALTSTSCGCTYPFVWAISSNTGICAQCLANQIVLLSNSCFTCPTLNGPGTVSGSGCNCNANYVWKPVSSGGSCICDITKAFVVGSLCLACPVSAPSNGNGSCVCPPASIWTLSATSGSCTSCKTIVGMVLLTNGSCLTCGTAGTFTGVKVVNTNNNSCTCNTTGFTWNPSGFCDCGTISAAVPSGNTYVCFPCNNTTAFTLAKTGTFACSCVSTALAWNSNTRSCACPSNSIIVGTGATATCFLCPTINGTGVANKTVCLCNTNFVWRANTTGGSCQCDFAKFYMVGTSCLPCPTSPPANGAGNGNGSCVCNGNNVWVLSAASGACAPCVITAGVVLLTNGNCFTCGKSGTYTLSKIENAANNSCSCIVSALIWNAAGYCDCGAEAVMVPSADTFICYTCANPAAFTTTKLSSLRCNCVSNTMVWTPAQRACVCPTNYILVGSGSSTFCFACPTANGTGIASGSTCGCNTNFVWQPNANGGRCVCDQTVAYIAGTNCLLCPAANPSNGVGSCTCTGTTVWSVTTNSGACLSCKVVPGVILLTNGACFTCGTSGTFTALKVVSATNSTCTCSSSTLVWNPIGYCDCGATSAMIITGNTFVCYTCNNATAFTSTKATSYSCNCVSANLVWNATSRTCGCAMGSIMVGSGSSITCFACPNSALMVGVSADQKTCVCVGKLVWIPSNSTCGCTSNTQIILGSGTSAQCMACSSIQYGKTVINPTTCSCLGTGLSFNSSGNGSCTCPAGNIILPNFTCFSCPSGATPLTSYECMCPVGSIWVYSSQSCVQCGGSSLPNSLVSGGTAMACICASSYVWDVMNQACVLASTCATVTPACMRCPTGSASTLVTSAARNRAMGATIQNLLNGTFTNYNQIKGYQCTCGSGFTWDSLRLRCFLSALL